MAKPKIFISSTYYDLKILRNDIERFILELGYDPILNERGKIPYSSDEKLEEGCYREAQRCDILIALIGGRRGSNSSDINYSISNKELKSALQYGKQVYIFIEHHVYTEFKTYLNNKDNESIQYVAVDDKRIYKFIEELNSLPLNNIMQPFSSAEDIIHFLKEQFAGLFQRLLEINSRQKEINTIENLNNISNTLTEMVNYLKEKSDNKDTAIKEIILINHPIFQKLRNLLDIPFRFMFSKYEELKGLLEFNGYVEFEGINPFNSDISWTKAHENQIYTLTIQHTLFDTTGILKTISSDEWNDKLITMAVGEIGTKFDDDIPF